MYGLTDSNSAMYSIPSGAVSVYGVPKDVLIEGRRVCYDEKENLQWLEQHFRRSRVPNNLKTISIAMQEAVRL